MTRQPILTGLLICSFAVGCGTTRSWNGLTSRFSKSQAEDDALVLDDEALSEGFRNSRGGFGAKGLKHPEGTNLAFARWKEDMDQYAEAKRRYHEILTANPDCLPARLGIARIERETGRFTQCLEILQTAQQQHPEDPTVMLELGRMYNERRQWNEAVAAFDRAAEIASEDQTIRYELGLALVNAGRMEEGLGHLKFAVGDSAAYYNVGFLLHEEGRTSEAVSWVERAMDSHPDERTRQMAGELLAEIQHQPIAPGYADSRAIAASTHQSSARPAPQIQAAATRPRRTGNARPAAAPLIQTASVPQPQPAATAVTASQNARVATVADAGTQVYSSGSTAVPQWSGPVRPQGQWSRSTRSQVPVHAAGFTQPVQQSADPPAWRR